MDSKIAFAVKSHAISESSSASLSETDGPDSKFANVTTTNIDNNDSANNLSNENETIAYNGLPISLNPEGYNSQTAPANASKARVMFFNITKAIIKYMRFIGPGAMTAVAYIDAGNFSSSVFSGAQFQYSLLFVMFIANCIAVFLQILAIRLGSVSGRDLAQLCHEEFPRWLNFIIYLLAETAIIATDIAEVVGSAVALNVLFGVPLIAGVVLTVVDVIFILFLYRSGRSVKFIYYFEYFVAALVFAVVICLAIELARIPPTSVGLIFKGFVPSKVIFEGDAMYAACSILGATVMPHSLYLGSSIVKPRLFERDLQLGNVQGKYASDKLDEYRPSLAAINYSLNFSVTELCVSLFTFALFVNAAILIVAGDTLYGTSDANDASLYAIYDSLTSLLSKGSGTLFMVALFFSGESAGIICTIAGQIVSEGHIQWKFKPWIRRIFTRCLAIIPCLAISGSVGKNGIGQVLNASQVALSILLPFLVLPLIYFTSRTSVMTIGYHQNSTQSQELPTKTKTILNSVSYIKEKTAASKRFITKPFSKYNPENNSYLTSRSTHSANTATPTTTQTEYVEQTVDGEIELVPQQTQESSINGSGVMHDVESHTSASVINKDFGRVGTLPPHPISYASGWFWTIVGFLVWLFLAILNVYLIVQLGLGNS